jgi:phosphoglycerate kinase
MKIKTLKNLDYKNKRVYLRVDFNVVENGKIIDEFRIEQSIPTIRELLSKKCSIILASHNGRPEGKPDKKLSLRPSSGASKYS